MCAIYLSLFLVALSNIVVLQAGDNERTIFCTCYHEDKVTNKNGEERYTKRSLCWFSEGNHHDELLTRLKLPLVEKWYSKKVVDYEDYLIAGSGKTLLPYTYAAIIKHADTNAYVLDDEYEPMRNAVNNYLSKRWEDVKSPSVRERIKYYKNLLDPMVFTKYDHECVGRIVRYRAVMCVLQWYPCVTAERLLKEQNNLKKNLGLDALASEIVTE